MRFKTLSVHLDHQPRCAACARLAADLAERFGAIRLDALQRLLASVHR